MSSLCWRCKKRAPGFWVRLITASPGERHTWCILCIESDGLRAAGIYEIISIEHAEVEGFPA